MSADENKFFGGCITILVCVFMPVLFNQHTTRSLHVSYLQRFDNKSPEIITITMFSLYLFFYLLFVAAVSAPAVVVAVLMVRAQETLQLRPVGRRDAGLYTCQAQNSVGSSEQLSVQLDIKCK